MDAKKNSVPAADVPSLLEKGSHVWVARGKNFQQYSTSDVNKSEELMKKLIGPSGNLRAPAFFVNDVWVVGYNSDMYNEVFAL